MLKECGPTGPENPCRLQINSQSKPSCCNPRSVRTDGFNVGPTSAVVGSRHWRRREVTSKRVWSFRLTPEGRYASSTSACLYDCNCEEGRQSTRLQNGKPPLTPLHKVEKKVRLPGLAFGTPLSQQPAYITAHDLPPHQSILHALNPNKPHVPTSRQLAWALMG